MAATGTSEPLIANTLAKEIFKAQDEVVRQATVHETAKMKLRAATDDLSKAHDHLGKLIKEARSGQKQLFDKGDPADRKKKPADPKGKAGDSEPPAGKAKKGSGRRGMISAK